MMNSKGVWFVTPHEYFCLHSISHTAKATMCCFRKSHTPFLVAASWDCDALGKGIHASLFHVLCLCPTLDIKLACPIKYPVSWRIFWWMWHHIPFFQVTQARAPQSTFCTEQDGYLPSSQAATKFSFSSMKTRIALTAS